jgi:hypothetical protein
MNPLDPSNPDSPMYQFIDAQPPSEYPATPDTSLSHITVRQFTPDSISASANNPIIVTKANHGLSNGMTVRATKFYPYPFAVATGLEQINNQLFYVYYVTTDTFTLCDSSSVPMRYPALTPYVSGGQFTVTGPDLPVVNPSHFPPPGTVVVPQP